MLEIEQSINEIVDALHSGTIPSNIIHIQDNIQRIEETVKQNSQDVLDLQSAQDKSISDSRNQIQRVEEQIKLASSELRCKVNTHTKFSMAGISRDIFGTQALKCSSSPENQQHNKLLCDT